MAGVAEQHRAQALADRARRGEVRRAQPGVGGDHPALGEPVPQRVRRGEGLLVDLRLEGVDEIAHESHGGWHRSPHGPDTGLSARAGGPPGVDAVLIATDVAPPRLIDAQLGAGTPLVLLGESGDPRCDRVALDGVRAAVDATEHLLHAGRRRIAAIGARPGAATGPAQPRTLGYQLAVRRAGLDLPDGYLRTTAEHRYEDGYRAARRLFAHEHRPDAVFCHSDRLAIGALRAAADAGLRVPADVAVIGIGDSAEGRYSRPTLTSVSADPALLARTAVALAVARLDRPEAPPARITAPHAILPRESTGPAG